jgi:glycosyltransferase involved in cell wall biosynthesis
VHAPESLLETLSAKLNRTTSNELPISPSVSFTDLAVASKLSQQLPPYSVVHAQGVRSAWICVLAKIMIDFRLVVTLHNPPPVSSTGQFILKMIAGRSHKIICVSKHIAKTLNSPKSVVIPNGVICDLLPINRNAVRAAFGNPGPDTFVVLCASRLSHEKGIDVIIRAAKMAPKITFAIAGDGPLHDHLKASALTAPNVLFLGQRNDITELMQAADCVVVPSRAEGQGIAVLEAFAAGTPVVATKVGGIPESITNGETGTLIAPESPKLLLTAIEGIRANPVHATAIANAAQQWVRINRNRLTQSGLVSRVYDEVRF